MAEGRSRSPAVKESTPSLQQETGWMQFSMLDMLTLVILHRHMGGDCQHCGHVIRATASLCISRNHLHDACACGSWFIWAAIAGILHRVGR